MRPITHPRAASPFSSRTERSSKSSFRRPQLSELTTSSHLLIRCKIGTTPPLRSTCSPSSMLQRSKRPPLVVQTVLIQREPDLQDLLLLRDRSEAIILCQLGCLRSCLGVQMPFGPGSLHSLGVRAMCMMKDSFGEWLRRLLVSKHRSASLHALP